jgi:hypothetical protein
LDIGDFLIVGLFRIGGVSSGLVEGTMVVIVFRIVFCSERGGADLEGGADDSSLSLSSRTMTSLLLGIAGRLWRLDGIGRFDGSSSEEISITSLDIVKLGVGIDLRGWAGLAVRKSMSFDIKAEEEVLPLRFAEGLRGSAVPETEYVRIINRR